MAGCVGLAAFAAAGPAGPFLLVPQGAAPSLRPWAWLPRRKRPIRYLKDTFYIMPSSASSSTVRTLPCPWDRRRDSAPLPALEFGLILICTVVSGAAHSQLEDRLRPCPVLICGTTTLRILVPRNSMALPIL